MSQLVAVVLPRAGSGPTFVFHKVGDWQWVLNHIGYFWNLSRTHLYLALISVLYGLVVSLPVGVLAARQRRAYAPILAVTTILYSMPSIAAFALLLGVTGLSNETLIIPLSAYSAVILVRSVADGLRAVPAETTLAAEAMGYKPFRRLVGVELPAALPVIIAGIRVATVASISLVTVGSLIGNGGLGQLFIAGEQNDFLTEVIAGIVLVVFWALVCDGLLVAAGRAATPWARRGRS